jgi:hypothetical protein
MQKSFIQSLQRAAAPKTQQPTRDVTPKSIARVKKIKASKLVERGLSPLRVWREGKDKIHKFQPNQVIIRTKLAGGGGVTPTPIQMGKSRNDMA